ncbi:hypothetical protein CU097_013662 [Rhizopus azygosporus]|uniref:Uncharacterized protein n=1 Tax=Rhizopus azygosporus TaxID=86630 RepID=A0A367JUF4_RHIAZ|nr:hypothetical protein CU097_013662 [Rhizopus azygosporus]
MNTQYITVIEGNVKRIADMENEFREVFSIGKVFGILFNIREAAKAISLKEEYENNHKLAFGDEKLVARQKDTQRIGCPCYIYAGKNEFQHFEIRNLIKWLRIAERTLFSVNWAQ